MERYICLYNCISIHQRLLNINFSNQERPWGDRRQELVFIGKDLNHEIIQKLLDKCLLQDDEMELGPRQWLEKYDCVDKIRLPGIRLV